MKLLANWLCLILSLLYKALAFEFKGESWFGNFRSPYNPRITSVIVFLLVHDLYIFGLSSAFFKKLTHIVPFSKLIFGWKIFVIKLHFGGEFG